MGRITLDRPWLTLDLGAPARVLSWAVHRPGIVSADRIVWREVRDSDLPPGLDVADWFAGELNRHGAGDAVAFLTSRDVTRFTECRATVEDVTVHAVATTGLSNAERVGTRTDYSGRDWGTINVAVQVSAGLTETALIETMSIIVQARTAAVIDAGWRLPSGLATGTGTDCIAVAAPTGGTCYAGLHTAVGEATGRAVYDAVAQGARDWLRDNRARGPA